MHHDPGGYIFVNIGHGKVEHLTLLDADFFDISQHK